MTLAKIVIKTVENKQGKTELRMKAEREAITLPITLLRKKTRPKKFKRFLDFLKPNLPGTGTR